MEQIRNVASLPVVGRHVAIMPDAHWDNGACVGSVIPTRAAIIPAAVGVDLGRGMVAIRIGLSFNDLEGRSPASVGPAGLGARVRRRLGPHPGEASPAQREAMRSTRW